MRIPILRLGDILLTSIQVDLTDAEVMQFQTDVLHAIADIEARGLVIEITALEVVDSFMARTINDTANMAQMIGAEVVVCGMRPAVALTLIEMGRGLIGVETTFNLNEGLARLNKKIAQRGDSSLTDDEDAV
ncbi:MAG: STAS domain-containing protein [Candidatus Competibacteraceae bacterium]|uniref:Sulfate transporter/antisigma-factor antagonist STAS n=1 Tax=Candidatus Contendobacter odensis Run_B_J11 TaxID=1400861 RepID=A0A7U7GEF4_9GAMM|nr:STAS domain-containing protein [Candidatus Contendobacter odensis]MBK8533737.1 STAS domain-containing protein [Candidatus Competibacteraceae bacterium]MBK8754099.1 STAS domain-containing protein [Candidatus Competibacteraceae bacterium]CDH46870.1 Sulfate transporter/antisigma-factor antagonist STAS [Candidatus Contendobacter odensis Run_B_J11]